MARKYWIKVWTEEWLDGSIREQLTPAERSIWIDLLVMSGRSRTPGIIRANETEPYTHEYLARRFNLPLNAVSTALEHFVEQGRITEDNTGLRILNWAKYQDPPPRKPPAES